MIVLERRPLGKSSHQSESAEGGTITSAFISQSHTWSAVVSGGLGPSASEGVSKLITQLIYLFIKYIQIHTVYDLGVKIVYKVAAFVCSEMHAICSVRAAGAEFDELRGSRGRFYGLASGAD